MKGNTNANVQLSSNDIPITVTSPIGETIYHSHCVKVGRTVYVGVIFNLSVARTNTSILKMVSTSSLVPIAMSNTPVFNYTQNGDNSTNVHRFVNVYHNSSDNANTVYINVSNDMTIPIGNWQLTFTYLTDA